MPRFVLLRHECPPGLAKPSHWDLMLEDGLALATWSLLELPAPPAASAPAVKLADHRLNYLAYEGTLSGGRGEVRRVDAGEFAESRRTATRWEFRIMGALLSGLATLDLRDGDMWTLSLVSELEAP